jgi:hypothetical protein
VCENRIEEAKSKDKSTEKLKNRMAGTPYGMRLPGCVCELRLEHFDVPQLLHHSCGLENRRFLLVVRLDTTDEVRLRRLQSLDQSSELLLELSRKGWLVHLCGASSLKLASVTFRCTSGFFGAKDPLHDLTYWKEVRRRCERCIDIGTHNLASSHRPCPPFVRRSNGLHQLDRRGACLRMGGGGHETMRTLESKGW